MRKFWLQVPVARAGGELQRARAADHARRLAVAERGFGRRAVQHGNRPIVPQPGLIVAEVQRAWRRLLQQRQAGRHGGVQDRRIGKRVQQRGAGELLGDRAHAKQRARREWDAALGVRPAPGMAKQHLAAAQDGNRTARSGVGARERANGGIERVGGVHALHSGARSASAQRCATEWWDPGEDARRHCVLAAGRRRDGGANPRL